MNFFKTAWHALLAAFVVSALLVTMMGPAAAQSSECVVDQYNNTVCPPAKTLCVLESNSRSVKCSPPEGGVIVDRYGAVQCGPGRCVLDIRGDPFCSKESGGAAAKGQYGDAVCTGGCVKAQASMCSTLTR
ncbi:MAG: hypothetical protein V4542_19005 [Pseudomonadota bacterium]